MIQLPKTTSVFHKKASIGDWTLRAKDLYISDGWIFGICNGGEAELLIDQKHRHLERNVIFVVVPRQIVSLNKYNNAFDISIVYLPVDFIVMIKQISLNANLRDTIFKQVNSDKLYQTLQDDYTGDNMPHIMDEENANEIRQIIGIFERHCSKERNENFDLKASLVLSAILIIMETLPIRSTKNQSLTRQQTLVKNFLSDLLDYHKEQHDVAFYAERAFVTPKYLSTVLHNETGVPALQWINRVVVFTAKSMLKSSDLSVSQIASELNFSSASAFIRFFKTQTGTTPLAYRH